MQVVCLYNADRAKEEAHIRRGCTTSGGAQEENQSKEPGMLGCLKCSDMLWHTCWWNLFKIAKH